jgi:hypothetical protein
MHVLVESIRTRTTRPTGAGYGRRPHPRPFLGHGGGRKCRNPRAVQDGLAILRMLVNNNRLDPGASEGNVGKGTDQPVTNRLSAC